MQNPEFSACAELSAQGMLPSEDPESRGDYSHQRISVMDSLIAFRKYSRTAANHRRECHFSAGKPKTNLSYCNN